MNRMPILRLLVLALALTGLPCCSSVLVLAITFLTAHGYCVLHWWSFGHSIQSRLTPFEAEALCLTPALAIQLGAIPLSASSLIAFSLFERCDKPIPCRTCAALVNWMFS